MSGFDTPIPVAFLVVWLVLTLATLVWTQRQFRRVVSPSYRLLLGTLRIVGCLLLLPLLLQPFLEIRTPDREGFRVAILADASQSMAVQDLAGERARFGIVRNALDRTNDNSLASRLAERYRADIALFSEELRSDRTGSGTGNRPALLPGGTALGDVLRDSLAEHSGVPLGAVVVLSDGQSNTGIAVSEAAKLARARDIPITCVGIGSSKRLADVSVRASGRALKAVKDQSVTLRATIRSTFESDISVTVDVSSGAGQIESRELVLPAGGEAKISFIVKPWRAGFQTYRVRVHPVPGDPRRDNDVDYIAVNVRDPDTFSVLYLGARLGWEFKFLRMVASESEQLSMAAVIRTGPEAYYTMGFPEGLVPKKNGFPEAPKILNHFDVIVLDLRALRTMSEAGRAALLGFVDHRGGGLLCTGPLTDLPESFLAALPVRQTEVSIPVRLLRLDANPEFVFHRDPTGILSAPQGLPVAPGDPVWFPSQIKKGARAAASVRHEARIALAAQRYGSGRIAYCGFDSTWRWRLESLEGEQRHRAFWNALLVWLGSTRKGRLQAECNGGKFGLGDEVPLDVSVLGTDFRPAPDATVKAVVTTPTGALREVDLQPSAEAAGRYTAIFFPDESGEHTIRYSVQTSNDNFEESAHFVARQLGVEAEDTTYREDVLRDLARVTRGRFLSFDKIGGLEELPLSERVPVKVTRWRWTESWLLLALLALVFGADWLFRRRLGLK